MTANHDSTDHDGTADRVRRTVAGAEGILEVDALERHFERGGFLASLFGSRSRVKAIDGVSFTVRRGENFGLVGESGSGKTTVAKQILRLDNPTGGMIRFRGADVHAMRGAELRGFRRDTHMVFQDPNSSLSPRMRVEDIISEPLQSQGTPGAELDRRVSEVLDVVGLAEQVRKRYPHEFSGGQRQRIAIARAVASNPSFVVLDEPVSALDVSIRSQILNLLRDLQDDLGLTYLTIAHDLAVVYQACDRTAVMYLGALMELAPSEDLFNRPLHPYTQLLVSAIPIPDPHARPERRVRIEGEIPSPTDPPSGCRYHPRCPYAEPRCRTERPEWRQVAPERWVACHLVEGERDPSGAERVSTGTSEVHIHRSTSV